MNVYNGCIYWITVSPVDEGGVYILWCSKTFPSPITIRVLAQLNSPTKSSLPLTIKKVARSIFIKATSSIVYIRIDDINEQYKNRVPEDTDGTLASYSYCEELPNMFYMYNQRKHINQSNSIIFHRNLCKKDTSFSCFKFNLKNCNSFLSNSDNNNVFSIGSIPEIFDLTMFYLRENLNENWVLF